MDIERKIKFIVIENDEDDLAGAKHGFINHRINAFVDEKMIGYIKLTLLPKDVFYKNNPTVWHYMENWRGWHCLTETGEPSPKEIARYHGIYLGSFLQWTKDQVDEAMRTWTQVAQQKMDKTIDFFLDKLYVCNIFVETEFRRQGVGSALYREAYYFCKERGFDLYSDSCQTKDASSVWNNLKDKGFAESIGNRFKIKKFD